MTVPVVSGHQGSVAVKLAFVAIVFGIGLIVNGLMSLGSRRVRGRDATMGLYRNQERLAPMSIRVGVALLATGLAGGMMLWILA